jgi:CubicO group peptidase (beta-lactamase class C family)
METTAVARLLRPYDKPDAPGISVLIAHRGQILWRQAFGLADLEARIPATPATNYRLASLTKQFTAMAIMILAARGRLSYDAGLHDFLPDFPAYGRSITLRHLLHHTSGLPDYEALISAGTTTPLTDRQVLALLAAQRRTYFTPGSRFRYSNSGYALLALVVEVVAGVPFAAFLDRNIFQLLGMRDTVAYESGRSTVSRRAYGYHSTPAGFVRRDQSLTSAVLGDGGIYSSTADLYHWDQALNGARLASRQALREAFTPGVWIKQDRLGYGFGWFCETYRGRPTVWHYGSTTGFRTAIERFPEQQFTVIVLRNYDEPDGQEMAAHTLARRLVDACLGT